MLLAINITRVILEETRIMALPLQSIGKLNTGDYASRAWQR